MAATERAHVFLALFTVLHFFQNICILVKMTFEVPTSRFYNPRYLNISPFFWLKFLRLFFCKSSEMS